MHMIGNLPLDKALDAAQSNGWIVVDMKEDWKRAFNFQQGDRGDGYHPRMNTCDPVTSATGVSLAR
jgi:hypothetical protein